MLDDPRHLSGREVAHDAAVARRVLDLGREDRHGVPVGGVRREELGERARVEQRDVSGDDDDRAREAVTDPTSLVTLGDARLGRLGVGRRVEHTERALDRAARAGDVVLVDDEDRGVDAHRVARHRLAFVPDDDRHTLRAQTLRRGDGMTEHAAPREGVEDLGCGRSHPRSFACGEDDDGCGLSGGHERTPGCSRCHAGVTERHASSAPRTRTWTKGTKNPCAADYTKAERTPPIVPAQGFAVG